MLSATEMRLTFEDYIVVAGSPPEQDALVCMDDMVPMVFC